MTQGGEGPGIGGVPGIAKGSTRAPQAWNALTKALFKDAPKQLDRSRRARASLLRATRRKK